MKNATLQRAIIRKIEEMDAKLTSTLEEMKPSLTWLLHRYQTILHEGYVYRALEECLLDPELTPIGEGKNVKRGRSIVMLPGGLEIEEEEDERVVRYYTTLERDGVYYRKLIELNRKKIKEKVFYKQPVQEYVEGIVSLERLRIILGFLRSHFCSHFLNEYET